MIDFCGHVIEPWTSISPGNVLVSSVIEASPPVMLYGTFLAKLLPNFCPSFFAVQHYSRVNFRFALWVQYRYVTAIHGFATLKLCCIAKVRKKFCQKSSIERYSRGSLSYKLLKENHCNYFFGTQVCKKFPVLGR
jgi:hypothetical protein